LPFAAQFRGEQVVIDVGELVRPLVSGVYHPHHPLQHKLSVVRTLLDRSSQIVTEEEDREQEEHHIHTALTRCGYPDWSINQVKSQMLTPKTKKTTRKRIRQLADEPKSTVVIPYVQDLSESVSRVYKRHSIPTAMRPFQSIRSLLVHPKDKHRPQDICECVYKIPRNNCNKT